MCDKIFFVFAFIINSRLVHAGKPSVIWTRVQSFENYVKVTGSQSELWEPSPIRCAFSCSVNSWCSSFFFLPGTGRCVLNEAVFATPTGGQVVPGAMYFIATNYDCPSQDGYVWVHGQQTCFKMYGGPATFYYAYRNCTSVGAQLISLKTSDKIYAVNLYIDDAYWGVQPYIGAARDGAVNGTLSGWNATLHPLKWLTGGLVALTGPDSHWGKEEPTNYKGEEGCVIMWPFQFGWNDVPCYFERPFVCERNIL